jgi:uncharacterized protein YceK
MRKITILLLLSTMILLNGCATLPRYDSPIPEWSRGNPEENYGVCQISGVGTNGGDGGGNAGGGIW